MLNKNFLGKISPTFKNTANPPFPPPNLFFRLPHPFLNLYRQESKKVPYHQHISFAAQFSIDPIPPGPFSIPKCPGFESEKHSSIPNLPTSCKAS